MNLAGVATLLVLAMGLFASTNLDDLFVLLGFFSDPKFKPWQVAVGQFFGIAALYAVSVAASRLALVIAPAYVGFLGVLPILIGLKKIWELRQDDETDDGDPQSRVGRWNALSVAAVTIADGGDNLSVYIPVFATRPGAEIAVIGGVFAAMTLAWLAGAFWLTSHRTLGAPIRRYGHRVVPFVLVGLGCYILYAAGSFALVARWI